MPVPRLLSRFVMLVLVALVTSLGAVLPAGLAMAAPSSPSSSVSMSIKQLPSSFAAGGKAGVFEGSVVSSGGSSAAKTYRQYVIRLTGLIAAHVKAEKQTSGDRWVTLPTIASSAGVVTVRDEEAQGQSTRIRLTFGAKAPPGRATITMEGYDQRDQRLLGRSSAYQTTITKVASPSASGSSASGAPADPPTNPPAVAEPAVVPSPAAAQPRADLPVAGTSGLLLGLGALMVFGGLAGVIVLALVSGRTPAPDTAPKEEPTG